MRSDDVTFYSGGVAMAGVLRRPDSPGPYAGIVQGPGWLGLKDAALYLPYHEALTAAGFAVLIFDYRGFGDSGGDKGTLSPGLQLQDLVNAVTFLRSLPDIDSERIGAFGSGGTGGGNAVLLAAHDERVQCAVSQVPVADGGDWLRRMRSSDEEWMAFLARLDVDRVRRVSTGEGEMVHPREEIMIPSAERRKTNVKKDVDGRVPTSVPLAAADEIIAYRPIDVAARVPGLCIVAVDGDLVTPTDHAEALYEAAPAPKQLIMQYDTTHYAAYQQHGPVVLPRIVEWFARHIGGPQGEEEAIVEVRE
jgi:dipeptidyl aminopeptidase/acylaminoacyl peptidase